MSVETIWNHPILFTMSSIIIGYMILQSLLFMKMGYEEALNLGVEKHTLKNIIKNSVAISILPTLPIIVSLFILVPVLGTAVPWLRLSVIGSAMFEMLAAELGAVAGGAPGLVPGISVEAWVSAVWVMCIGGASCLFTALVFIKPFCASYNLIGTKSKNLVSMLGLAATVSLISSILVDNIQKGKSQTITIICCCLFAIIISKISAKLKSTFLKDLILPLTILFGLMISILFANYLA